jgi:DNA-binding MurR/RpiR family transcriptional regulator
MGRSLSVASYLSYALQNLGRPAHFLSGVGGDPRQAMRAISPEDVLIAISFAPYAAETQACMQLARDSGARTLALTDSVLAPICALSDVQLFAPEQTAFEFKTLTSTICLAQALFIALAHTLERQSNPDSYSSGR